MHLDPYGPCENADVLVVLTEWDEFRWLDFAKVAGVMNTPRIVDTRNLLEPPLDISLKPALEPAVWAEQLSASPLPNGTLRRTGQARQSSSDGLGNSVPLVEGVQPGPDTRHAPPRP